MDITEKRIRAIRSRIKHNRAKVIYLTDLGQWMKAWIFIKAIQFQKDSIIRIRKK